MTYVTCAVVIYLICPQSPSGAAWACAYTYQAITPVHVTYIYITWSPILTLILNTSLDSVLLKNNISKDSVHFSTSYLHLLKICIC